MITFKQFLTEAPNKLPSNVTKAWDKEDLSIDKMIELVNANCRESLRAIQQPSGLLYRGFGITPGKTKDTPVFLDSTDAHRMSRDSNNIYQLIMDVAPQLLAARIPSRSNSFICSTDIYQAKQHSAGFGVFPHVVLPFNNTPLAYVKTDDIFNVKFSCPLLSIKNKGPSDFGSIFQSKIYSIRITSEKDKGFKSAAALNSKLASYDPELLAIAFSVNENLEVRLSRIFDTELLKNKATKEEIGKIEYALDGIEVPKFQKILVGAIAKYKSALTPEFADKVKQIRKNHDSLFDYIAKTTIDSSPVKFNKAVSGSKLPKDVEVWFSGKCIAIPFKVFQKMLIKMHENGTHIHKNVLNEFGLKYL